MYTLDNSFNLNIDEINLVNKEIGILVLETNNLAMVLPKIESPHLNIINPEPGTMAYDTVTKQLAVYND